MERHQIVERINQLMYNELFSYDDIKYELDKAINEINIILQSEYPPMTEILLQEGSKYFREVVEVTELPQKPSMEDKKKLFSLDGVLYYCVSRKDSKYVAVSEKFKELIPFKYIHSVVIPYAVAQLFARLDEFGSSYQKFSMDFDNGLIMMFRDFHQAVPEEFQDNMGGIIKTNPAIGGIF